MDCTYLNKWSFLFLASLLVRVNSLPHISVVHMWCVCVCVHARMHMWCKCVKYGWKKALGVLLYHFLPHSLRKGLSLNLRLTIFQAGLLSSKHKQSLVAIPPQHPSPTTGVIGTSTSRAFSIVLGNWTQVLRLANRVLLSTEPSPLPRGNYCRGCFLLKLLLYDVNISVYLDIYLGMQISPWPMALTIP